MQEPFVVSMSLGSKPVIVEIRKKKYLRHKFLVMVLCKIRLYLGIYMSELNGLQLPCSRRILQVDQEHCSLTSRLLIDQVA